MPPTPSTTVSRSFREVFGENGQTNFLEMIVFIAAIDSVKFSSKSEPSSRFFGRLKFSESNFCETLNGRLPLEDGSDRPQTWPKRVSDESRHFIFWRPKKKMMKFSEQKSPDEIKSHYFGGATLVWARLAAPSRKMTPDEIIFGSVRLLVEG